MNILLLSAGRRVELLKCIEKAAQEITNGKSIVKCADSNPKHSAACKLARKAFTIPKANEETYIEELFQLTQKEDIRIVIPTIDTELSILAEHRNMFETNNVVVMVSDRSIIEACDDKIKNQELFNSIGITCPEILNKKNLKYPCLKKPIIGNSSKGIRVINNESELSSKDIEDTGYIYQEYIGADWEEYSIDCWFSQDNRLISMVPRKRIQTRGGEISKGIIGKKSIINKLRPLISKLKGARGCITVQIFNNPSTEDILGIEINPRFGGGYPMSHAAGAGYPELMISEIIAKQKVTWRDKWKEDLLMLRYDAMVMSNE